MGKGKSPHFKGKIKKQNKKLFHNKNIHFILIIGLTALIVFILVERVSGNFNVSYNYLYASGILGIISLISVMAVLYLKIFHPDVAKSRNKSILIAFIILIAVSLAAIIPNDYVLIVPVLIVPMLLTILIDIRLAVAINFVVSFLFFLMNGNNSEVLIMTITGGIFSAYFVSKAKQRSTLSASGALAGLINALVLLFTGLIGNVDIIDILSNCGIGFLNGLMAGILTLGLLPFMESIFNIVTPLKLMELSNPNQPLIKRLLMEAPGTYHHSLMVGNLAEAGAEAIGANALLARIGAYFHDIGKLARPSFFNENQLGENPHDKMTPNLSTLVITSHPRDGYELAEEENLPEAVKKIILEHHGTTLVSYFYNKAQKEENSNNANEEAFRYECPKPTSREAAVVMLADSVEAAVRSIKNKTEGKIEGTIRKIILEKQSDGQLEQCALTFKDLYNIKNAFVKVFSGYFHERKSYPVIKKQKKTK